MELSKTNMSGLRKQGLAVTEFMLRLMAWLCTKDNPGIGNSQICIVTGPNIDIATKLIKRLKNIFERRLGIYFDNKETVLELNACTIEAYPSNHIDSFRALDNPNPSIGRIRFLEKERD